MRGRILSTQNTRPRGTLALEHVHEHKVLENGLLCVTIPTLLRPILVVSFMTQLLRLLHQLFLLVL